jgi:hypothetical protein
MFFAECFYRSKRDPEKDGHIITMDTEKKERSARTFQQHPRPQTTTPSAIGVKVSGLIEERHHTSSSTPQAREHAHQTRSSLFSSTIHASW